MIEQSMRGLLSGQLRAEVQAVVWTTREWAWIQFVRWLVQTGRLSEGGDARPGSRE